MIRFKFKPEYEQGKDHRGKVSFIEKGVYRRMIKNQYFPVLMRNGKILFRDT